MIDINLHQVSEQDLKINRRKTIFKSSFSWAFVLLIIVLIALAVTKFYQKRLINEKEKISQLKLNESTSFNDHTISDLIDFKKRLNDVVFNLQNKDNPKKILNNVEQLMIKGVSLNSLTYDDTENILKIEVVTDSFRLASSQMLSLKKSDLFKDVSISGSGRNESGQAVLNLNAVIKK